MPIRYKKISEDEKHKTEILKELKECSEDIVYFAEKYFHIISFKNGKQLIKLPQYQKNVLYNYNEKKNVIVLAPRQSFKTTSNIIYALWYAIFNNNKTIALLSNNANLSKITLLELKTAYENMPEYLKPAVVTYNAKQIVFDNGSEIISGPVTPTALRGTGIDLIILDEFSFVSDKVAEDFFISHIPVLSAVSGKCIISSSLSTKGLLFKKLWKNAEAESFTPVRVYWWEVEGRDEAWKEEMIRIIGKATFDREYNCQFEDD